MHYDGHEIEYLYKNSKNRNREIKILAELNLVDKYDICHLLHERGALDIEKGTCSQKYMAFRMMSEGKTNEHIMNKLGVSLNDVTALRQRYPSYDYLFINKSEQEKMKESCEELKKEIKQLKNEMRDAFVIIKILQKDIKQLSSEKGRKN